METSNKFTDLSLPERVLFACLVMLKVRDNKKDGRNLAKYCFNVGMIEIEEYNKITEHEDLR